MYTKREPGGGRHAEVGNSQLGQLCNPLHSLRAVGSPSHRGIYPVKASMCAGCLRRLMVLASTDHLETKAKGLVTLQKWQAGHWWAPIPRLQLPRHLWAMAVAKRWMPSASSPSNSASFPPLLFFLPRVLCRPTSLVIEHVNRFWWSKHEMLLQHRRFV